MLKFILLHSYFILLHLCGRFKPLLSLVHVQSSQFVCIVGCPERRSYAVTRRVMNRMLWNATSIPRLEDWSRPDVALSQIQFSDRSTLPRFQQNTPATLDVRSSLIGRDVKMLLLGSSNATRRTRHDTAIISSSVFFACELCQMSIIYPPRKLLQILLGV